MQENMYTLFDFEQPTSEPVWFPVDDVVMGGVSSSSFQRTDHGTALFTGHVSLENNGGFASVRTRLASHDLSAYTGLILRVLGDGKRYGMRVRAGESPEGTNYQSYFETTADTWQDISIPFRELQAMSRGKVIEPAPTFDPRQIRAFGLLIANKQSGNFCLEIASLKAYKNM